MLIYLSLFRYLFHFLTLVFSSLAHSLLSSTCYNPLPLSQEVGDKLGLDTRTPVTLWKDQAALEVNIAVLHSYQVRVKRGLSFSALLSLSPADEILFLNRLAAH